MRLASAQQRAPAVAVPPISNKDFVNKQPLHIVTTVNVATVNVATVKLKIDERLNSDQQNMIDFGSKDLFLFPAMPSSPSSLPPRAR